VGYGVLELDLGTGTSVQHRPRGKGEAQPAEALPFPSDVESAFFDGGAAWYGTLEGVSRFQTGGFETWGENDGLPSELVWKVGRGNDGEIWAATSGGLARFGSGSWHAFGADDLATHGLALDGLGRAWVATARGLRALDRGVSDVASAPTVAAGDMRDLALDRTGRIWALSPATIVVVTPAR
jgi:ligand-binding sensor domain-containing protein